MLRYFEDLPVGWSETFGPVTVTKESLLAFAREYDPQPFHADEEAAKDTFAGTLIASGWQTCALTMRMLAEGLLLHATSMGAPGIDELRWLKPVLPGDALRARFTVTDARESKSRPGIGLLQFATEILNQRDEAVMTQSNWIMFGRRGHPWPPAPGAGPRESANAASPPELGPLRPPPSFDELQVGDTSELGAHRFDAEEIIRFAKAYDPQPFHVDPEAARHSLFGGLCASGWHTAAVWMKRMIVYRDALEAEAQRFGRRPARLGPSPGFKNMRWSKPVYAGDTIAYRSTVVALRPSASRPDWGLAFLRHSGSNQRGEEVFSFEGSVFWERRHRET
jgi:acyl dehydratase